MAGGLLQLVSNTDAPQNQWLNCQPEITFFKTVFRRHTPFATETISLNLPNLDFGSRASIKIPQLGDLIYRMFVVMDIPELRAAFTHTKAQDAVTAVRSAKLDSNIQSQLEACTHGPDQIEFDSILTTIADALESYYASAQIYDSMLTALEHLSNASSIDSLLAKPSQQLALESGLHQFKLKLFDTCFDCDPRYGLMYELIKLVYLADYEIHSQTPLLHASEIVNTHVLEPLLPDLQVRSGVIDFYSRLNAFNAYARVLESLSSATPITLKYANTNPRNKTSIDHTLKQTWTDNLIGSYISTDPAYQPLHIQSLLDHIYPTMHPYLALVQARTASMFTSLQQAFDRVSTIYSQQLLTFPMTSIYTYDQSTPDFGVLYLHFFKYLDTIDAQAFATWIDQAGYKLIDAPTLAFLKNATILLQINIEFYMHDASAVLNTLHTSSSHDPNQLVYTLHRNHVPSIPDMFEYIDQFLSTVTITTINTYLELDLLELDPRAERQARAIARQLYRSIFKHFTAVYEGLGYDPFESGHRLSVSPVLRSPSSLISSDSISSPEFGVEIDPKHTAAVELFVDYLLYGTPNIPQQQSLVQNRASMEFYFITETIHAQLLQQYYYDLLLNADLLGGVLGVDSTSLIGAVQQLTSVHNSVLSSDLNRYKGKPYAESPKPAFDSRHIPAQTNDLTKVHPSYFQPQPRIEYNQYLYYIAVQLLKDEGMVQPAVLDYLYTSILSTGDHDLIEILGEWRAGKHIDPTTVAQVIDALAAIPHIPLTTQALLQAHRDLESVRANPSTTPLTLVLALRDNWVLQYAYTRDHQQFISNLESVQALNTHASTLLFDLISAASSGSMLELLRELPIQAYLYPHLFPEHTQALLSMYANLDDLSAYLFTILLPRITSGQTGLMPRDVTALLQHTFNAVHEIYTNSQSDGTIEQILLDLKPYQPILLAKLALYKELVAYLKSTSRPQARQLVEIAVSYGINQEAFEEYAHTELLVNEDIVRLNLDLDRFLLLAYPHIPKGSSIKDSILKYVFVHSSPLVQLYAQYIDAEYYAYVYYFLATVAASGDSALVTSISMPTLTPSHRTAADWLEATIDTIFESSLQLSVPLPFNQPSDSTIAIDPAPTDVVTALAKASTKLELESILLNLPSQSTNSAWTAIQHEQFIIDNLKTHLQARVLAVQTYIDDIKVLQHQLASILYRNHDAPQAWIRKLAHYLIEEITFQRADDAGETHPSDWFESYYNLAVSAGIDEGYLKMIGHKSDLITYSTSAKGKTTIALPLIFYFNRDAALALPLISSTHTNYQLTIKLRDLNEVAFRAEYSTYTDAHGHPIHPHISNARIEFECIYLSGEERKVFATQYLNYLMDEVQVGDTISLNDSSLEPVLRLDVRVPKGLVPPPCEESYVTSTSLANRTFDFEPSVRPNTNWLLQQRLNRSGLLQFYFARAHTDLPSSIHRKRITIQHHFNNPTKLMVSMCVMQAHRNPSLRCTDQLRSYFPGEIQWDNYGLYPYYDLRPYYAVQYEHYNQFASRITDLFDPDYGLVSLLAELPSPTSSAILEALGSIELGPSNTNIVRLIEHVLSLGIEYDITEPLILQQLVTDVYEQFDPQVSMPNTDDLFVTYPVTGRTFSETLTHDLATYVLKGLVTPEYVQSVIHTIYSVYCEAVVIHTVSQINSYTSPKSKHFNLTTCIEFGANMYLTRDNSDETVCRALTLIRNLVSRMQPDQLAIWESTPVIAITIKADLLLILGYLKPSSLALMYDALAVRPYSNIRLLSSQLLAKLNERIDQTHVSVITPHSVIVPLPSINPVLAAHLELNGAPLKASHPSSLVLSELEAYRTCKRTPSPGLNLYSWSLDPWAIQPQGHINMSRIAHVTSVIDVHPAITDSNPATYQSIALSTNIVRYLSGLSGRMWIS